MDIFFLVCAAFVAGFIEASIGGGALIQLPSLFVFAPSLTAATLIGTNKFSSVFGQLSATWRYRQLIVPTWPLILKGQIAAIVGIVLGTLLLLQLRVHDLRLLVSIAIALTLVVFILRPKLGGKDLFDADNKSNTLRILLIGIGFGLYDGVIAAGSGVFLILVLIAWTSCDFLRASAFAKAVNLAANIAALSILASLGHIDYAIAAPMACANMIGSAIGAKLALKKGNVYLRRIFIGIVIIFLLKMIFD